MSWETIRLGDIASFSNGINFDKTAYSRGIKLIGVSDFGNRFFPDIINLQEVKREIVRDGDLLKDGDIVFVRSNGNKELVGRCMLISQISEPITFSGFVIRARLHDTEKYDPVFFTYHFKNIAFRRAMSGTAVGANIQNLSQGRLSSYIAKIPDVDTQQRIVNYLFPFDKLIENNQKQIKLLEEAAQRLYKEWFVDLRFPGWETTKIVDGVPEGWRKKRVADIGKVITGKTPSTSKKEYYDGDIPFVTIPDMHDTVYPIHTERTLSNEGANSQKGKFIPVDSIMVSCIATVGLVNITLDDCQTNQQINSIIPNEKEMLYYIFCSMKRIKALLDGVGSNGATMTNVNKSKFENIEVLLPPTKLQQMFYDFCAPIFGNIKALSFSIDNAKQARDHLLPKLMSGELEV